MRVIRAEAMGMCFGVRDALQVIETIDHPPSVTIHGELVHNAEVTSRLESRRFRQTAEDDRDALPSTPTVLITAHGVSEAERARLRQANKNLIDTTCPLVRRVHEAAGKLHDEGRLVVVLGKHGHVEVRGITEDLERFVVIGSADEVRTFSESQIGVVCQTTLPPDLAETLVETIRSANPSSDIRVIDTICQPTRLRQRAMTELLSQVEAVVVIGGHNSNNTRQLVRRCQRSGVPAQHVACADELDREWLSRFGTVGLTAGTSTLPETVDAVHDAIMNCPSDLLQESNDG